MLGCIYPDIVLHTTLHHLIAPLDIIYKHFIAHPILRRNTHKS